MKANMKLLTEWCPINTTKEAIKESRERYDGKIMLSGIIQRANTLNQNGRVYPKHILDREAKKYQKDYIDQNRALGELDHPESSKINHITRSTCPLCRLEF